MRVEFLQTYVNSKVRRGELSSTEVLSGTFQVVLLTEFAVVLGADLQCFVPEL